MTVLTIIGILVVAFILYKLVLKFNDYSYSKYKYEFIEIGSFILTVISYALLFFGNKWYIEAVEKNGDTLNGTILMGIGAIWLLLTIFTNIKSTSFVFGLFGSIFQLFIYLIGSVFAIILVFVVLIFLEKTRPVYKIN